MSAAARHPQLVALLICERVIRESDTGLPSSIGVLDRIRAFRLPLTVPRLLVFVRMTDAEGEYECELEIVRRDDNETIAAIPAARFAVHDPLASAEVVMRIGELQFAAPGFCDFRFWVNDRFLGSVAIQVDQVESNGGD